MLENDMESIRHQKLREHYKTILKDAPVFGVTLQKNDLLTCMRQITTLAFKPTDALPF